MTDRKETPLFRCHHPRKRMIQYAAASRFIINASGILGRPVKPGDDSFAPGDDSFGLGRASRIMTDRKETPLFFCHHPRKRMIQYATAPRLIISASGILGRPVKPGDDTFATGDDSFAQGDDSFVVGS